MFTKPSPATTNPNIAAGPTAAKATCIIVVIAEVIPPNAPIPTLAAEESPPPILGNSPINPLTFLETKSNADFKGPDKIPEKLIKPAVNEANIGKGLFKVSAPPKRPANGKILEIIFCILAKASLDNSVPLTK